MFSLEKMAKVVKQPHVMVEKLGHWFHLSVHHYKLQYIS